MVEAGFLRRLPFLNEQPVGWKKVGEVRSAEYFTVIGRITDAITESPVPLGFAKIEHGRYGIFEPLPDAHEGRRSER